MLEVRNLTVAYGQHPALNEVSINVAPGEIVVILGANGAGKSTLLRAISGVCEGRVAGDIQFDATPLGPLSPDQIVARGVALVPEGRGIFGDLTVGENLALGAYSDRARHDEAANLDRVLRLFPKLRERQSQIARTMSGGEQQMVAIARAMMSAPKILMLDEPSLGLSPLLCKELFQNLATVKDLGIGVLLVEQNAKQSLSIADRGYLLENTRITHEDSASRLATDPAVQKAYLGAGSKTTRKAGAVEHDPMPTKPVVPAKAPPRQSVAEQGIDIDDILETATRVSRRPPPAQSNANRAEVDRVVASRLDDVMKEIEAAARNARQRPSQVARPGAGKPAPAAPPSDNTPPPVIEIYRRPRVEVYRRRPSGEFERS